MANDPSVWERFELIGELKRGGMGIIYKSHDREQQVPVALKMVSSADKQLLQSIRREIHALGRIHHPGVVHIVAEGVHDGMPWYAMEFIEADTLLDHCRTVTSWRLWAERGSGIAEEEFDDGDGPTGVTSKTAVAVSSGLPSRAGALVLPKSGLTLTGDDLLAILTLVRRLCVPLSHIHGEGLVHLDLKPDNVLIRDSGLPVILDFGLATAVRSQSGGDVLEGASLGAGTVRYMAPEQIDGDLVDARADTYALGCILYQLLTGRVPFPGPSVAETIFGHLNLDPTPPSELVGGIPPAIDELVLRMLAKKPRDRIGYAQDIDSALARLGAQGWVGAVPSARAYVYRPRLAGRDAELALLVQQFELAQGDSTRLVLLGGESGIGKTRLVGEFARVTATSASGAEVFFGEFRPHGGPLHGFRRILQGIADICRSVSVELRQHILGRRAATLSRYEPELQWFVSETESPPELLPDAAREQLFQDFLQVLIALGENQPLVVILDDLQWADDLSLGFLEYLRAHAHSTPLRGIVLATYRSGESSAYVDAMAAHAEVLHILLGRLSLEAVGTLISDMLALPEISAQVVESLYQHSEGNPLFLTEYLLESVAEELIWRDADGTWHARGGSSLEVDYARLPLPTTVHELLVHRLAALGADARRLAEVAAVLGPEPDLSVLERAVALPDAAFFDALAELQRRHVLEPKDTQRLVFAHSKVREVTYAQIAAGPRAQLHLLVAETLAALPVDHPARKSAVIAEHFYAGDDEGSALPHALQAGDEARALYGHDEAERFYLRAITTLETIGDTKNTTRTLMKLGLVHTAAFQSDKARQVYDQAFRYWGRLRDENPGAARTAQLCVATGEPMSLDPGRTYDTDSAFLQRQLFACLVEVDEEANVLPAVASRWQVSADGKVYTFFLRPDARWSNGTALTARHFEYAWRRNLNPTLASPAAQLLDVLENGRSYRLGRAFAQQLGVHAKGPHELEVRLTAPIGYLLQLLAHPITAPLPDWLIESKGPAWASPDNIITNGPFKVVRWVHGSLFHMQHNRFDSVFAEGNVRELRCRIFNDYREALKAYEQGEVEMLDMAAADAQLVDELRRKHAAELKSVPTQSTSYLVFRADRPPFNDARVRRAFAHAIDRKRLAAAALQVGAQPATGGFVPPGVPGHSPDLMLPYQTDKARELLREADRGAADFAQVRWLHTHGIVDPAILEVLRTSWQLAFGITLEPTVLRWKEYQKQVDAGVPDLQIATWTADFSDPDNFLRAVFHSSSGLNEPKWRSTEFDMLVDNAAGRTDQGGRMNFYRAADRTLVVDDAVIVPLTYGREPVLVKPWIQRFPRTASWQRHLKNCVVQDSARKPVGAS